MLSKFHFMFFLFLLIIPVILFTGCGLEDSDNTLTSISDAISEVSSVETTILVDLQAHTEQSGSSGGHSASFLSDITITSTFEPYAYHAESFSRILVDNAASRQDKEIYVVKDGEDYIRYEYNAEEEVWEETTLSCQDEAVIPLKTGVVQDWERLLNDLSLEESKIETGEDSAADKYSGTADPGIIEEILGEPVFGSFFYSMQQLLNDGIPCTLYVDCESGLPLQIILDFKESFAVSDMYFDTATITVNYSEWDEYDEISVPKKVSVVSENPDADFYSSYFAWNLFLPYVGGDGSETQDNTAETTRFTSSWDTFQLRLDNRLTTLPFSYNELNKLGYVLDENYTDLIIDPNKYLASVPVLKGEDKIYCTFYNDGTKAKPITECDIGSIDIQKQDQKRDGIKLILPGEILLGISKDDLLAAYGEPDKIESSFACDTYTWSGEGKKQSFLAEISPDKNVVIRLRLENIPVTGGKMK